MARMLGAAVAAIGLLIGLGLGMDGPPHDPQKSHDGDLEGEHEPEEAPRHGGDCTRAVGAMHAGMSAPAIERRCVRSSRRAAHCRRGRLRAHGALDSITENREFVGV
jgi:hypothetical protein